MYSVDMQEGWFGTEEFHEFSSGLVERYRKGLEEDYFIGMFWEQVKDLSEKHTMGNFISLTEGIAGKFQSEGIEVNVSFTMFRETPGPSVWGCGNIKILPRELSDLLEKRDPYEEEAILAINFKTWEKDDVKV